jgi:predicted DCC family thiol-disulfide oxidoreductase YuxK
MKKAQIFFDGTCKLCNASVRFIIKNDPNSFFSFLPLQSDEATKLLKPRGLDPSKLNTVVLILGQDLFTESTAALKIASFLRWPWKLLSIFIIIPKGIRDRAYRWVAKT